MDARKDVVKAQFGKAAEAYVTSETHGNKTALSRLVEILQPDPSWVGLDIATGGGHVAATMAPHVSRMIASDLTQEMLAAARRHLEANHHHNVDYVIADAERLPFLDDSFDFIACRIAAHHFLSPRAFVAEVRRVLKPGGRFLFVDNIAPEDEEGADFLNTFEKMRDVSHQRCLSVSEWTQLFQDQGLSVVKQETNKKMLAFDPWMRRMAESDEHVRKVEQFLITANVNQMSAFSIEVADGRVTRLGIDEWTAVCE